MRTVRNEIYRNNRILTGISTGIFGFREGDIFCKRSLTEGARHLQSMQAEDPGILRLTSTVCFAMAALALLLAVIFFILFDIRTIFRIRTGSARKKRIRELHEKNIGDHIENNTAGYNAANYDAANNNMETNNIENDIGDRKTALKETLALFGAVLCLRALVLQVLLPVQAVPLPKTQNRPAVFAENIAEPATGTGRRPDPADAAGLAAADGKRDAASGEASDGMTGPAADGKEEEKADKGRTKAEETADEGGTKPGGTSGKDGMKPGETAGEGGTKPGGTLGKDGMKPDETADEDRTNPVNRVDENGSESGDPGAGKRQDSAEKSNGDAPLSPDHPDPEKERGTESEEKTETENEKEERDGEAADAQETADSGQAGKNGVKKEVQKGNGDSADTKRETPVPAENDCDKGANGHNTKDYKWKLEKDNDKGTDGGKPVLTRIRLQPQGKGAGRTFLIREGNTEEVMEGAARDYTVTVWAEDLPEQGFSGLELAQYRLEPLQGQGDVLTAVVPFSLQEGPENGQDPVRTAVSTPRPLTDGENSLFPKAEAEGACRLCLSVADGDGNWSEEAEITVTFDRTPPGIEAALADPPGAEDWPSCRRADNCAVDVIIREDHLQSWEIRIGSELAVTDKNVPAAWIREGSGEGTAEILVPAREVCKNKDGDVAVTVRAVDEAGQSTGFLDRAGGGLAEKRNEEGQIEAAVFSLDTTPPEILVEHRVPGGGTACLYADREDRRDLTLYSPVPVVTTITAADRGGGPGEPGEAPDPGRIRAVCFYKSPGSGACTERELDGAGPVPDGEGGRMWRAEFAADESAEGSYYFLVEVTDRAGNISRNGLDAAPSTGPQTIHSCPEILRKTGVLDFRAGGTGTGSGQPASDLRAGFTLVYDRTPPELSLTCSSPATAYLYKADTGADAPDSLPQIEACLKQPLTAQAQIVREENPDPSRVFFVLSESVPPGVEPRLTRLPIPEGRTGRTFSTTSDGRYIFFLYGQDKAGNGATVAEELASASANREWTGPVVFSPEKNCGTAGRPHFAYSVDTTPPEAEILYTADGENVYLYEEKIAGAGPEAGDGSGQTRTAEPGVSAYGRGSISPSVTIRDRNRLDPDLLQVMEYRGSSPSEMSGKEKMLVPGVVSPAGNGAGDSGAASSEGQGSSAAGSSENPGSSGYPESVLTASGIRSLTGPRECAFYAVRGTDRAGNVLKVTERFGGKGKALPGGTGGYRGRPEASGRPGEPREDGASGADAGWYTARFLLVVDRIPPEIAMTFTPEKNDRKIYLYQETIQEGGPQYAAYFHGTIHPAVTVSEENAIDPDRLVLSVYAGKNRLPEKGTGLSFPCGPAGGGTAGDGGPAVNGRAGQDTVPVDGTRPVSGLKPLQADGTLAFYEAAGTDRAGNPVRIVQDQVTGSARCSGLDRKGRRIPAAASDAQRKVDQRNPVYRSRLLFVIDRTPPELCLTYVSAARFYLYGDRREGKGTEAAARTVAAAGTGTAAKTVAAAGTGTEAKTVPAGGTGPKAKTVPAASVTPDTAKADSAGSDAGHVYAFLSGKVEVKASVTGKNEHIDPGRLFYTCAEGKGKKSGVKKWDREAGMDLLCTDREGEYRFSIWGEDKAGNPAAVTEVIEGKTENRTGSAAAFKKGLKERTEGCGTGYASRCSLVIDRTPPKITLEYSLPGATAFVYADGTDGAGKASGKASGAAAGAGADPAGTGRSSGGSGTDDGGARPAGAGSSSAGLQACISGKAEAVFSLEEENPDRSRLFYNRSFRPYLTAPKEADRIRSSWRKTAVFRLPAGSGDGAYSFGAWGRDRAGNPAAVIERFAAGTRVNRQYAPVGCSTARAAGDCGTGYRPLFTIIIDTTPPVYSFSINQPAKLADRFDAARDREIVYYGRAVSGIRAVYRVEDMNFDKNRIRSGICSQLAAGSGGPDHEESGAGHEESRADSDSFSRVSPAWEPPALECTGSSVSGGRTKAIFEMQVEVCSRHEGSYRFSIGGSDMAGNLLRPSAAQGRNDRSGALKARAAATYPCGTSGSSSGAKNNGQYWSGRKVIDVTPPTGDLRVFDGDGPAGTAGRGGKGGKGGQEGGEAFYQFRFDMDANRPVRYEPFRSESRAAALIGTRDLSPTRVTCALRSLDRDRDRIFAASNPVVSGGDRGWNEDNSLEMKVSGDQVFYLEKILLEDRAGNVRINEPGAAWTMAESGRIYLDTDSPRVSPVTDAEAPEVRILADGRFTRHEADGERYIYRPAGKTLDLKVSVTDPGGAARSSGLSKVSLRVTAGDVDITDRVTAKGIPYESNIKKRKKMDKNGNTKIKDTDLLYEIRDAAIHIPTASFAQSNDITVRVEAADNSGNRSSVSRDGGLVRLGIDTVGPLVEVVYRDQAPPVNEKFFAGGRQAEIIVTDRNMDSEKIRIRTNMDAKGGFEAPHPNRTSDGRGEKGDGDRWVKRLAADRDGDYSLDLDGTDALGNRIRQVQWKGPAPRAFTVDRTVPVISIFLQNTDVRNGRYYNRAQTALITVREHNFRRQDLKLELTASAGGDDPRPPEPEPTAFSADGDFHTASVCFDRDGCYSIRVSCTDPAGNRAREAVCGEFVVDMTPPKLLFDRSGPFRFGPAGSGGPGETADTGASAFLAEEAGAAASNGPAGSGGPGETADTGASAFLAEEAGAAASNAPAVERSAGASAPPAGGWTSNLPLDDCIYTGGLFRPRVRVEDAWFDADRSYFTAEGAGRGTVYRARPEAKVQNRYSSDPPETRGVLRTLFAQNPSLTARGARKAYWNRRAQRCMYTPFEGACTETQNRCIDLCLPEFEIKKSFDDVYYVKACAVDLAGNRSPLARFRFSLNRFGSTFEEGDAGGGRPDPENSRTCAYVRRYYNNRVDGPVSVREISPVRITQYRIYRTKDGFSRELKEGEEYRRITEKETDGDCRYRYEIDDRVFAGDGHYSFLLVTRDREGNENSTAQMMEDGAEPESRDREGNENSTARVMEDGAEPESMRVTSFPIAFCVDRTPPSIRIAGVDPHERRIRARSLDLTVLPEDGQSGVSSVELRFRTGWRGNGRDIPGRVLICSYIDPEVPDPEAAEETAPAAGAVARSAAEAGSSGGPDPEPAAQTELVDLHNLTRDGRIEIPVHLEEEARWQLIEIVTRDRAGNESTDTSLHFLVTTDPLVRFLALIEPAAPAAAVLVPALLALFLAAACRKKGSAGSRGL